MTGPFNYSTHITGQWNIGREADARALGNLLIQGENVVIAEAPKAGKGSLVRQCFLNLKNQGCKFVPVVADMMNIRSTENFALRLGGRLLKACYATPAEYGSAVARLLEGTHFVFDGEAYSRDGEALSLGWALDDHDLEALFALPYRLSRELGKKVFVLIEEFQNIGFTQGQDRICKALESVFCNLGEQDRACAAYIMSGSRINAMEQILRGPYRLKKLTERIRLGEVETRHIIDHVIKGFNASGKVIDRELLLGVCKLFRNNLCYINHFCSICDSMTRGFIMSGILNKALSTLISIHVPRFKSMMYDLTGHQASFLKAILDGHTKFSSTEIIERYRLNSSANVLRVKEALCKKEIIYFDESGKPVVTDPLFEYWAKTEYYGIQI